MQSFFYKRPEDADQALTIARQPDSRFIGGAMADGGVSLGALARNSDTASHPLVRQRYPLLAQALLSGASAQLRNMATNGGNLLQRTRCYYFNDPAFPMCNKRAPGSGCGALAGCNRIHAILGASDACIATHPSDMCVALAALDAVVVVRGPMGERRIPILGFHRLPGDRPQQDTMLEPDELILAIELPPSPYMDHCHYLKIRDRASYAFALVSVAAGLWLKEGVVLNATIALGGVAHKPWRVPAAEAPLIGHQVATPEFDRQAAVVAEAILAGAHGYRDNQFKVRLAHRCIVRALQLAGQPAGGAA
jgi:xanthine dehydrogenase YagS FAD-binding subunit